MSDDQHVQPGREAPGWWPIYVRVLEAIVGGMLIAAVVVTFGNIARRSLGFGVFSWADETSRRLLIWMTFLGAALAIVRASHLKIDAFLDWAPPHHARILRVIIGVLSVAFFLMLIIEGGSFASGSRARTTVAMNVSALWNTAVLPIGGVLMLFTFAARARYGPPPPRVATAPTADGDPAKDD